MPKFKIIFEVRNEADEVVVQSSQTDLYLSIEELAGRTLIEASKYQIECLTTGKEPDPNQLRGAKLVREAFEGAGALIGRYIEIKLRELARGG